MKYSLLISLLIGIFALCLIYVLTVRITIKGKIEIIKIPFISLLFAYAMVTSFVNIACENNLGESYRWIFISIGLPLTYVCAYIIFYYYSSLREIYILIISISCSVLIIIMMFTGPSGEFPSIHGIINSRVGVYFKDSQFGPTTISDISGLIFVCAATLWLHSRNKIVIFLCFILIPIMLSTLVIAGGRTAFVAAILATLVSFKNSSRSKSTKIIVLCFIVAFSIACVGYLQLCSEKRDFWNRILLNDYSLGIFFEDVSGKTRLDLWSKATEIFSEHPMGIGFIAFPKMYGKTTHNEYLNQLLGAGILGFIILSVFLILCLYKLFSVRNKTEVRITIACCIFMILLSFMESWTLSNTPVAVLSWVFLALGVSSGVEYKKRLQSRPINI